MHCVMKTASTLVLASVLLGSSISSAAAFRLAAPSSTLGTSKNLAAFNGETKAEAASEGFLLSPSEVNHIRWCAAQYRSYHAIDDTIADRSGNRAPCVSPIL
jgi:hypothetical protein